MAKSKASFMKKELEKKRLKKKAEKNERKINKVKAVGKDWKEMIAYVDEDGNLSESAPVPKPIKPGAPRA